LNAELKADVGKRGEGKECPSGSYWGWGEETKEKLNLPFGVPK